LGNRIYIWPPTPEGIDSLEEIGIAEKVLETILPLLIKITNTFSMNLIELLKRLDKRKDEAYGYWFL